MIFFRILLWASVALLGYCVYLIGSALYRYYLAWRRGSHDALAAAALPLSEEIGDDKQMSDGLRGMLGRHRSHDRFHIDD